MHGQTLAGKAEQALDHRASSLTSIGDGLHVFAQHRPLGRFHQMNAGNTHHGPENIVHVMRNSPCERAETIHLFIAPSLSFVLLAFFLVAFAFCEIPEIRDGM